jgi:riboflavin kinase/FMN adenylyltransferase
MKILHSLQSWPPSEPIVLALGFFDGCHKGHQKVFSEAKKFAYEKGAAAGVLTLYPHPSFILNPSAPVKLLQTLKEKEESFSHEGFQTAIVLPVDRKFLEEDAQSFLDRLSSYSCIKGIFAGENFTFGKEALGRPDLLKRVLSARGIDVHIVPLLKDQSGSRVSSTHIREAVREGNFDLVRSLLGRNYRLSGTVVHGLHRGHDILGFPTANMSPDPVKILPADGVYAVKTWINGKAYPAVTNIGNNPTFHNTEKTIETFILSFNESIYDEPFTIEWIQRLRGEVAFPDFESLKKQIEKDVEKTKQLLMKP